MSDQADRCGVSATLLAAQARLQALQRAQQSERKRLGLSIGQRPNGRFPEANPKSQSSSTNQPRQWPAHLGWESAALTAVQKRAERARRQLHQQTDARALNWLPPLPQRRSKVALHSNGGAVPSASIANQVKIYPDIALALLRTEQVAAGRIWLLLHHLDQDGRGWLSTAEARAALTKAGAPQRVCSWRHLRNLLTRGEGIFWQQEGERPADGRLWLRSAAKVAGALGVPKLHGRPVAIPVAALSQSIGDVRAHLYASFHSGRNAAQEAGPIARATLKRLSGVSRRSQRRYEQRAGVRRRANYALGDKLNQTCEQERAWQHGRALFRFHDRCGKVGPPNGRYLAWQLPNNYTGPHASRPKGRQKQINQELADLFMQGMTGNDECPIDRSGDSSSRRRTNRADRSHPERLREDKRRYYRTGRLVGAAYNRAPNRDLYWKSNGRRSRDGRSQFWHLLPAK